MRCVIAMLLTALLFGCQEEERAPWAHSLQSGGDPMTGKPMREVLERGLADDEVLRCDIRKADCQQRIFATTAAVRGGDAKRPPVTVIPRDALAAQLNEDAEDEVPDEVLGTLTALGLVTPDLAAEDVAEHKADGILAAYSSKVDRVIVVDHGRPLDTIEAALTLSHEFVHALQDGDHDLTALRQAATTTDQREGLLGLVEGEAEVFSALAITGEVKTETQYWQRMRRAVVSGVIKNEAPYFAADINFPYTFGNEFVTKTYGAEGSEGVVRRYSAIPTGSREILAGFDAETPAAGWGEVVDGTAAAVVEAGYAPVFEDAFGAWVFHVFLELVAGGEEGRVSRLPGESVARALRGDRVVAWERDGDLVVSWQLRFDLEVDPAEVVDEITAAGNPDLLVREDAGDVIVFATRQTNALVPFATGFELPPR